MFLFFHMNSKFNKGVFAILLTLFFTSGFFAQTEETPTRNVNFGYSRNPVSKPKNPADNQAVQEQTKNQVESTPENVSENNFPGRSVAQKTLEVAKRRSKESMPPTEIYKVGIGDVLFISIQNAPSSNSTYFTVLNDGTIDYALAGEMVSVAGLTTEEIEDVLRTKIKLYENPQIAVKVREYASHPITVLGLVEKAGEKFLQREAVPLFVVKAEAIVESKATQAIIRRANSEIETADLKDPKTDDILILPGDIIEFSAGADFRMNSTQPQFYYIGGEVMKIGQKDFYPGITLTQAILASGGLRKSNARQIVIRRKSSEGLLVSNEFDLREIKNGKIPDPVLQAGDTIEILK